MSQLPSDDPDRTVIRPAPAAPEPPASEAPAASAVEPPAVEPPAAAPAAAPAPSAARDNNLSGLPLGTYLNEFELTGMLGEGGFGIVYTAWDHSLERRVALKEYMPSALAMRSGGTSVQVKSERHRDTFEAGMKSFINEARLLAKFDHPSLVKVYRFWEANGTAYMVMPLYEGTTLKDRLRELGSAPDEATLLRLLDPLTRALMVIHEDNCFHRDIAPDNVILLAGSDAPLLLDFGAARRVIGDMTQALTVILKPGYAPVEQYAEAPGMKQGAWTDVYALAALVYFAIMGKTPPPSVSRLMTDSYVPLVESAAGRYSERLLAGVDRALRVRPEDRTQSVAEFRRDIGLDDASLPLPATAAAPAATARSATSATTSQTSPAPRASREPQPAQRAGSPRWLWPAVGVAVLAAGGGGAYWAMRPAPALKPAASQAVASGTPPAAAPAQPANPPATGAAPAVPPAPPAATGLDANTEFDNAVASQTAGFTVEAFATHDRLRIDHDLLGFRVHSTRDGYVTVLVLGPDGSLTELIPSQTMPKIRIRAGETLQLPPAGVQIGVSEPTGLEKFLVLVSSAPRSYAAYAPKVDGGYATLPTGDAAAAGMSALRAQGLPALLGSARDCSGASCNDYGAARFSVDVVR